MTTQEHLSNPHNWIAEPLDRPEFVFWDPVQEYTANPNTVPAWLEAEPLLKAGVDHMRASDTTIRIAYGRHAKAEDLGDIENGWFEHQVYQADHYGYEEVGHTETQAQTEFSFAMRALQKTLQRDPDYHAYLQAATSLEPRLQDNTFLVRRLRMMATANNSFSYDVRSGQTMTEQAILRALARTAYAQPTPQNAAEHLAAVNAREWCMVANTGLHLLKDRSTDPANIFMTSGFVHGDVTRKFKLAGAEVNPKIVGYNGNLAAANPLRRAVTAIHTAGKLSMQDAARLIQMPSAMRGALRNFIE